MRDKLRLAVVVLMTACGGGGDVPDLPPSLALGSSAEGFELLTPGGTILLHRGPQGGFHVYLAVRASGVDPGTTGETPRLCDDPSGGHNPCIDFEVSDLDAAKEVDSFAALRIPLSASAAAPGTFELVPPRLVTMAVTGFGELDGHHLRIKATLDDAHGVHVEDTRDVICRAAQ